jgi:hypothetical protein
MSDRKGPTRHAVAAVLVICMVAPAAPASAQGPPSTSLAPPVVDGDYVNLSATITSTDNCQNLGGDCQATYIISTPPLPPTAGIAVGSLFWANEAQPQKLPFTQNMRAVRSILSPSTSTYTVVLAAQYAGATITYSSPQTFTWPAGSLSVTSVKLLGSRSRRVAYRLRSGKTPFRSAIATVTIRTAHGKRLGSFRVHAEPGQNLARLPRLLARRLAAGVHYRITLRVRDEFGRTARTSSLALL